MPTDLFKLYRKIERRTRLDPHDFHKWELTELAHDLVRRRLDRDELLAMAATMLEVERQLPFRQTAYSRVLRLAVEADDYEIRVPWLPAGPPDDLERATGTLYIATAWSRPGLVKFGATYDDPQARVARYAERYGYPVKLFWSAAVRNPFRLELSVRNRLDEHRAPDSAYHDFIGWYRTTPEDLRSLVESELEDRQDED